MESEPMLPYALSLFGGLVVAIVATALLEHGTPGVKNPGIKLLVSFLGAVVFFPLSASSLLWLVPLALAIGGWFFYGNVVVRNLADRMRSHFGKDGK